MTSSSVNRCYCPLNAVPNYNAWWPRHGCCTTAVSNWESHVRPQKTIISPRDTIPLHYHVIATLQQSEQMLSSQMPQVIRHILISII